MTTVHVSGVTDFDELGVRWRDLEQRAAGSFFLSWTWMGCLVAERFVDPVLVEAVEAGRTIALALFNRVRRWVGPATLYLSESGITGLDCPYIEQNGVLAEAGREAELTALCLQAVLSSHNLFLSGIGAPVLEAVQRAAGLVVVERMQASPFVDLAHLRKTDTDYLAERSANTRQQIRRSDRFYKQNGPIAVEQAGSLAEAQVMLDQVAILHQASWTARGHPGSFAQPFFRRFHDALLPSAFPRGEIQLLKASFGETTIGILYNFVYRRRVYAYQSGFAYPQGVSRAKPGLGCHYWAIQSAIGQEVDVYDFLAGEDRYKRSLADQSHPQIWAQAGGRCSPRLLLRRGLNRLRQCRKTIVAQTGRQQESSSSDIN